MDELVQERCNSSALAMELRLSCTNPSISMAAVQACSNTITNTLELLQSCTKPSVSSSMPDHEIIVLMQPVLTDLIVILVGAVRAWLTHWVREKMAAIFQTTFSNAFS